LLARSISIARRRLETGLLRFGRGEFHEVRSSLPAGEFAELSYAVRKAAEQLETQFRGLTDERERVNAILRSMVEGVAVVDAQERIVFCNRAFAAIFGTSEASARGRLLVELVRYPDVLEHVRGVLAGKELDPIEVETGTTRPRSFSLTAALSTSVTGPEGNTAGEAAHHRGAVLVLHETTEIRRLERVRRDFVANVSHEFKTPLTAIQGFAETLLGGALADARNNRRFIEIIRDHASRLGRLTDDLTKLSLIEAGQVELDFQAVDVRELIEGCIETASIKAGPKQIQMTDEIPEGLPRVSADPIRLREVLQNLVDNAVQYTPPGGRIEVRASGDTGAGGSRVVHFRVTDSGIGIPQSDQVRIFERFYRVDAARSREVGGTGLGLAIAKHLVEAHGGHIWVESQVGVGSSFHFTIPAGA
jgi:two-component system phosphate regulon sensor histidine kinase PhoR